jgi:predicted transcriptional regulator
MTTTTIKVSKEVRDRLKAQASAAHITLGQHLERLAEAADRGMRFEALRRAIETTSDESLAAWASEAREWTEADLGTDA